MGKGATKKAISFFLFCSFAQSVGRNMLCESIQHKVGPEETFINTKDFSLLSPPKALKFSHYTVCPLVKSMWLTGDAPLRCLSKKELTPHLQGAWATDSLQLLKPLETAFTFKPRSCSLRHGQGLSKTRTEQDNGRGSILFTKLNQQYWPYHPHFTSHKNEVQQGWEMDHVTTLVLELILKPGFLQH